MKIKKHLSNKILKHFLLFACLSGAFLLFSGPKDKEAIASSDAIALRTVPNNEHYSPSRWYLINVKAKGAPQSLLVDGYEAIRDGRTVYVNAANLDIATGNFYTNIYIISYNQAADTETVDILGQILRNWGFNINLTNAVEECQPGTAAKCLTDADCQTGQKCASPKAKVTRDTKRLADLAEIKIALAEYRENNGKYPPLQSGTYLAGKTVSVWPSWQNNFAGELGIKPLYTDPINNLGPCIDYYPSPNNSRFDPKTCWDEKVKQFADSNLASTTLELPEGSRAYVYNSNDNGSFYNLCAVMESGYITELSQGACFGSAQNKIFVKHEGEVDNIMPTLSASLPVGKLGNSAAPYQGMIFATDPDKDKLNWNNNNIEYIDAANWDKGWSVKPVKLDDTNDPYKKLFKGTIRPTYFIQGNYEFKVKIDDGRGGVAEQKFSISTGNNPPIIKAIDPLNVLIEENINLTIEASDLEENYPLKFTYAKLPSQLLKGTVTESYIEPRRIKISGKPAVEGEFSFDITAADSLLAESAKFPLRINVINNAPIIITPLDCKTVVRNGDEYECIIKAKDPDNHAIDNFEITGLVSGLGLAGETTGTPKAARIFGTLTATGTYPITITTFDQYGKKSLTAEYNLKVNDYCGDGKVQYPNMERKGGTKGLGLEECDVFGGKGTSIKDQWECGLCQWKGGWCGDNICSSTYETCGSCENDCNKIDIDADGVGDCFDNCINIRNPEQDDADDDGKGDLCDSCFNYEDVNGNIRCVELTIQQGAWESKFRPYMGKYSSKEFYCYDGNCDRSHTINGSSSNLADYYNFSQSQRSEVFAFLNAKSSKLLLSLGFLHDKPKDGTGGKVNFSFDGSGWKLATISVVDDPEQTPDEFSNTGGNWEWGPCCTDGGMANIADLNTYWKVKITPDFVSGINKWVVKIPGAKTDEIIEIPSMTGMATIIYDPNANPLIQPGE